MIPAMSPENAINVFISDDHEIYRKGLIGVCKSKGISVVGESGRSADTLAHCFDKPIDVLIVDLNMDTTNGMETIQALLDKYPETKCLVSSMRESISVIDAAYKLGVYGYVPKSEHLNVLVAAIKKIAAGNKFYLDGMPERLLEVSLSGEANPRNILSKKELVLFIHMANGQSYEDIANICNISTKSVKNASLIIKKKLKINIASFSWVARKYDLIDMDL